MKILTGRFKDVTIPFREQPGLRPTPDRVRKAIVDALTPGWEDSSVLDLFSGTGALGLEALSAGARSVCFVESDRRRADQVRQTLGSLGAADRSRVECGDAITVLKALTADGESFDRVLADPPYEKGLGQATLEHFSQGASLRPGAWIVLETFKKELFPEQIGRLQRRKSVQYGDTAVHYYVLI